MTLALIIQIIRNIPLLIKTISEVWIYIMRVSHGKPEQLVKEVHDILEGSNNAKTVEERQAVAKRISLLWANGVHESMPEKK